MHKSVGTPFVVITLTRQYHSKMKLIMGVSDVRLGRRVEVSHLLLEQLERLHFVNCHEIELLLLLSQKSDFVLFKY